MKKFPHQQFIEDNKIALDTLPKMLQKRIKGFEELEDDLEHTTEHDREQLVSKLELLSHEIAEDLEEQFEDQLENNDEEDEELDESEPEMKKPEVEEPAIKEEIPAIDEVAIPITSEITATEPEVVIEAKDSTSEDEDILNQLYQKKQLKVSPMQLIRKGFKKKLDNKVIAVGKYALYRGKYDTCYTLLLKEK